MYAVLLSSSLLSKEEDERTAEFLLAKPVTRAEIVTQKALAFLFYVTLYMATVWGASYLAMKAWVAGGFDERAFWLLGGMTYLAILAMAGIGFLGSVFVTRSRTVTSAALGLVLALYALQMMADLSEKMRSLAYLTPFKWASAADILPAGRVNGVYLAVALATIVLSLACTYAAYGRKDIRT